MGVKKQFARNEINIYAAKSKQTLYRILKSHGVWGILNTRIVGGIHAEETALTGTKLFKEDIQKSKLHKIQQRIRKSIEICMIVGPRLRQRVKKICKEDQSFSGNQ